MPIRFSARDKDCHTLRNLTSGTSSSTKPSCHRASWGFVPSNSTKSSSHGTSWGLLFTSRRNPVAELRGGFISTSSTKSSGHGTLWGMLFTTRRNPPVTELRGALCIMSGSSTKSCHFPSLSKLERHIKKALSSLQSEFGRCWLFIASCASSRLTIGNTQTLWFPYVIIRQLSATLPGRAAETRPVTS
jgi:hypothetical protein